MYVILCYLLSKMSLKRYMSLVTSCLPFSAKQVQDRNKVFSIIETHGTASSFYSHYTGRYFEYKYRRR